MKPSATSATKSNSSLTPKKKSKNSTPSKNHPFIFARESAESVLQLLRQHYPDAHCALKHKNSFELLVATVLSAQCTDERVNKVTPALFEKFPTAEAMAQAPQDEIEELIRSTNFFKNKAKNLKSLSQSLVQKHQGQVPQKMEALVALAGVGRKTANVVLGNAFKIATGVVVDTHVSRLSQRLGWSKEVDPVKIESDLMALFSEGEWIQLSHDLIFHGRQICWARRPACDLCFLFDLCPKNKV